jgi:hypothetical protein
MKIEFTDKSYIEVQKSDGKIVIMLYAKDAENPRKGIINSCEMTKEQFIELCKEAIGESLI